MDIQENIPKKKGRPRKNPLQNITVSHNTPDDVKDIDKIDMKQKRKRGRKAAVKYVSSSLRKKIALPVTTIKDNDKSILHIDIPETQDALLIKKEITYDVLKSEYIKSDQHSEDILGNFIATQTLNNKMPTIENNIYSSNVTYNKHRNLFNIMECGDTTDNDTTNNDTTNNDTNDNDTNDNDTTNNDTTNTTNTEALYDMDLKKLYKDKLDIRIQQDMLLSQKLEEIHNDDELFNNLIQTINNKINIVENEIQENINVNDSNRKFGYFTILDDFLAEYDWPKSTSVCCWWCCHSFQTIPIGLPIEYKYDKFITKGIFCSFSCALAYRNDSKTIKNCKNELINLLFKKLTGCYINDRDAYKQMLYTRLKNLGINDETLVTNYVNHLAKLVKEKLEPAPPRCALKMFGGELTIEEFRQQTEEPKIYKLIEYPMCIARDYVQEIDVQTLKNANASVFNLPQPKKPAAKGINQFIEF
jgi:hypothetical protein